VKIAAVRQCLHTSRHFNFLFLFIHSVLIQNCFSNPFRDVGRFIIIEFQKYSQKIKRKTSSKIPRAKFLCCSYYWRYLYIPKALPSESLFASPAWRLNVILIRNAEWVYLRLQLTNGLLFPKIVKFEKSWTQINAYYTSRAKDSFSPNLSVCKLIKFWWNHSNGKNTRSKGISVGHFYFCFGLRQLQCLVKCSVLSAFIDLRSAVRVFMLWTSCLVINK